MSKKEQGIEEYIYEMLLDLLKLECSEAFRYPVDVILCKCPDYYTIIKDPMDLTTLTINYKDGIYKTMKEVKSDVDKIIKNCRTFNTDPNHVILKTCLKFESCFNSRWNKLNDIRIQLGIPDDYILNVRMEKLDQIESRKNKKKEPALLKDDLMGRKPRQPKIDMPKIATKPTSNYPNQIKFKISSMYQDDEPYVDSASVKNESENPAETKIQFKKEMIAPNSHTFKVQIPKPHEPEQQKEIEPPIIPKTTEQPMKVSLSVKIPSLSKINSQTVTAPQQTIQPPPPIYYPPPPIYQPPPPVIQQPPPVTYQAPPPVITYQAPPPVIQQPPPPVIYQPPPQTQVLPPPIEKPPQTQQPPLLQPPTQPSQQLPFTQQTNPWQPPPSSIPSSNELIRPPIPKKPEASKVVSDTSTIEKEPLPKINFFNLPENKTLNHNEVKFTLPPKPYNAIPPLPKATQSPKQLPNVVKQTDKPLLTPKIVNKVDINGPSTPKVRKIVDSDDEMEKISQIPIIKKNSEKKVEPECLSFNSSEKKVSNAIPPFNLNESELKLHPKESIKQPLLLPPPPPPPPPKVEPPKYVFKMDLNQIFKGEQDYQTKKMEKLKKFAAKTMANLKQFVTQRKPQVELLNKWVEIPSKTSLRLIHIWLRNDFDKIQFTDFSQISKYIELASKCISKLKCDEDPQAELQLQQCFEKEKEDEKNRLKKLEQELKEQQQPIILEKIDIEQLCKTVRVRPKKKKGNEKDKAEKLKEIEKEKAQQKPPQIEFQGFSLEPIKKVKLNQVVFSNHESEEEDLEPETDWWQVLESKKKLSNGHMEVEKPEEKKYISLRTLNQVQIRKTLRLGEQNNNGGYPKVTVEKMFFFLMNSQSTYFKQNKLILNQFIQKLRNAEKKNELYQQVSTSNYYVDEKHTELFDIYKIDNYAEVIVKLQYQDEEQFDPKNLPQKINIDISINNTLSFLSKENFINYSKINKQFQLKLAQCPQQISEPILLSKLYEKNETFIDILDSTQMENELGCGLVMCNFVQIPSRNEYSCQIQLLIPFTCIQDLQVTISETSIFNGQKIQ